MNSVRYSCHACHVGVPHSKAASMDAGMGADPYAPMRWGGGLCGRSVSRTLRSARLPGAIEATRADCTSPCSASTCRRRPMASSSAKVKAVATASSSLKMAVSAHDEEL